MTNLSIIEIENLSLRDRLKEQRAALAELAAAVRRYVEPRKGDAYCSRTEILLAAAKAESVVRGRRRGNLRTTPREQ